MLLKYVYKGMHHIYVGSLNHNLISNQDDFTRCR